jgi:hypothetical protein
MKAGCIFVLCIFALAAGFGCMYLLSLNWPKSLQTDPHLPPAPQPPPPDPNKYLPYVNSLNEFHQKDLPDAYRVTYGFVDYNGKTHRVTCNINKKDHKNEMDSYGYDDKLFDKLSAHDLAEYFGHEIREKDLHPILELKFPNAGRYQWSYQIPAGPADWQNEKKREIKKYLKDLDQRVKERYHLIMNRLLAERGFQMKNYLITINYKDLVLHGQRPLYDCFQRLRESGQKYNERQNLGMYLAFFQEIKYQVPPDLIDGRETVGLWVPTEVVANDHGDCDSKSVAFAAMIKSFGLPSIVISVPHHALVGVESKPGPDQKFVRVGNRYFVLCEVAGPGKWAPGNEGKEDVKGTFEYQLIEPSEGF